MLINLSNHPSSLWSEEQLFAASIYGEIYDISFPAIDANGDEQYISILADTYKDKVLQLSGNEKIYVHVMGEMTFVYAFLERMRKLSIICIASTTKRIATESEDGKKESLFKFVRFRKYNN
jgi:hypothetical protein